MTRLNFICKTRRLKGYPSIMTTIVDAIYENGKLVLQQPLPLPEHAHVARDYRVGFGARGLVKALRRVAHEGLG